MTKTRQSLIVLLISSFLAGAHAQSERPSIALVLGGGGARGFAHIAVLELIEEMGIPIDMITGVSAGAIVGGLYAVGYSPAMILETLKTGNWASYFQDRPVSPFLKRSDDLPLALTLGYSQGDMFLDLGKGYSTGQRAYELYKSLTVKFPSFLDFDDLPIPFRAGAVEVPGGKFELLEKGDLAEAIRASTSIQGVFEPFAIDGKNYVDGGMLNNLPVREVREMGFDIVIAVDPFVPPEEFDTSLMELPDLMSILYTSQMSKGQHGYADAVLFPLPVDVSMMDFDRGIEIYDIAKGEREKLAAILEPIMQRTATSGYTQSGYAPVSPTEKPESYADRPPIVPESITMQGALKRDRSYIEGAFTRLVMGRALERENVTAFLESVYGTGNYRMATVRTNLRSGDALLELILYPETGNKFLLRSTLDFEGTYSSETFGSTALRGGLEFLGKDGLSLLLKASIMDELSIGFSMFRPLGPHFFLAGEADLVREQTLTVQGIVSRQEEATYPNRLLYFRGVPLKGGLAINRHNSFSLGLEYLWLLKPMAGKSEAYSTAGIAAAYTYSSLDHSLFPFRGFHLRLENYFRFILSDYKPFDLAGIDFTAAIPLGANFTANISGFASSVFGGPELLTGISTFALESANRAFFPHAPGVFSGEKRAALSLALGFSPLENLSILGGRLVFSLALAAGRAGSFSWEEWADFGNGGLIWNASLGAAFVPVRNFGLQVRAGAGGKGKPVPFVSLDIGMARLQKRLFY